MPTAAGFANMDMLRPMELAVLDRPDRDRVTSIRFNDESVMNSWNCRSSKNVGSTATDGKKIHCWVIHPPDFDSDSKNSGQ